MQTESVRNKVVVLMDMPLFPYRIYVYNRLADLGYDLTVVSMSDKEFQYEIPLKFKHIRLQYTTVAGFRVVRSLGRINPDDYDVIIVAPNLRMLDFYRFYNRKYWNKLIGWGHHKGCTSGNRVAAAFRNRLFRKFAALIFYDYNTCEDYRRNGYDPSGLFVANNTQYVDPETVDLTRERRYFLYLGRIQERKGVDLALKAFAEVPEETRADVRFRIIGGGDQAGLKQLAETLHIRHLVDFDGAIHDEKVLGEVFSEALAYVSPGHVGLGVLHSFAFGVPVITCVDRKHSVEFSNCTAENSYLVPYTVEGVACAMRAVLEDKEGLRAKSHNAYEYYNRYCTIDKMVEGVDGAIRYVLAK